MHELLVRRYVAGIGTDGFARPGRAVDAVAVLRRDDPFGGRIAQGKRRGTASELGEY